MGTTGSRMLTWGAVALLALAAATLLVACVVVAVHDDGSGRPSPAPAADGGDGDGAAGASRGPAPTSAAREVLRDWDAARAAAWRTGDPAALAALYAPGSDAGRRDVAMLRRWQARGLRVRGLVPQVLRLDVLARAPGRLVLRVTDRMVGAVAVGAGGSQALPRDGVDRRLVELRRAADRRATWRVWSVRSASSPGRR